MDLSTTIEGDAVVGAQPILSAKDYSRLIKRLSDSLIRKDIRKIVFLCHDFIKDKDFLTKKDLTAMKLFIEMNRNGSISTENVAVLSQVMYLIGKKKLQKDELTSRGIPAWQPGMKSILCDFRHLLYKLYQEIRAEDLKSMKDYCQLTGKLDNSALAEISDALDLFTALIDRQVISSSDIDFLGLLVEEVHNVKMNEMVATYEKRFVDKHKATPDHKPPKHQDGEGKPFDSAVKPMDCQSPPTSLLLGGGTLSPGSYMDERAAGPWLKRPDQFTDVSQPRMEDFDSGVSKMSIDPHCLPESGAAYSGLIGQGSGGTHSDEERSGLFKYPSPASVDPVSATSSEGQAKLEKKTEELDEEIKKVGARGDEAFNQAGQPPEESMETELSGTFSNMGVHSLDKTDMNHTAMTEGVRHVIDGLKQKEQTARYTGPGEMEHQEEGRMEKLRNEESDVDSSKPAAMTEVQRQEEEKARMAEAKARVLESEEMGELGDEEEEKPRAKEKEKEVKSPDHIKVPMQETAAAGGSAAPSTMSMVDHPIAHPPKDAYPMTKEPRGFCLILSYDKYKTKHKSRDGNGEDIRKLEELFGDDLKFDVKVEKNKTEKETDAIIQEMREREDHGDCFVCFVCSHGDGEAFLTHDGKWMKFQYLYDNFTADKCVALDEKPKLFFMNCCLRKEDVIKFQKFHKADPTNLESDGPESMGIGAKEKKLLPKHAHFFIAYSTIAGYSSARQPASGTIFVQNIYTVFKAHHKSCELSNLLRKVRSSTNDQLQKRAKEQLLKGGREDMICQVNIDCDALFNPLYFP